MMLLYPKFSAQIFKLLRCRTLGPVGAAVGSLSSVAATTVVAVLEAEYSVDCNDPQYRTRCRSYMIVRCPSLGGCRPNRSASTTAQADAPCPTQAPSRPHR
jgi:hypothetical protein